jgi:hypothetical protein
MRAQADQFTVDEMRGWWLERDLLGVPGEVLISARSTVEETVAAIEHPR